ncbi:hypothetical protein AB6A40_010752 [Gnathostoma spinigerum]|uniref:MARVEL domain-containing protein n=1 Tax=Gnathostoma spinigerum TaxID=75299 RepID=A0ABD6F2B6_9BILA
MVELDLEFPKKWPFGLLKTAQWVACIILIINLFCLRYHWGGVSFVLFCAWTMLIVSLFSWIAHVIGWNRQTFMLGGAAFFIPFALTDFVYSAIFFLFFCISALICLVDMFASFPYTAGLIVGYFFATCFCLVLAAVCGYLAISLYRVAPNGFILGLRTTVISGDKAEQLQVGTSATTATPATQPNIFPPPKGPNPV